MDTIFVQIASYKDPELPKTIADCIAKATYPERLRFGICWQKTEDETLGKYLDDPRFSVFPVDWKESRGVGWARNICNSLYKYETFTLQIDSHHRFAKGWDVDLIEQWKTCKHPKAVLSGYPPGFEYRDDGQITYNALPPMTMVVKGFDYGFIPTFKSWHVVNTRQVKAPFRGCFIAAGFLFTIGKVCEEVPYAKEVYFTGEEILHSLRLFTFGYRVYYPDRWLIWHLYERKSSEKHWDNFTKQEDLKPAFSDIQLASTDCLKRSLVGDPKYRHFFGDISSIADFEAYCGVSFQHRTIHPNQLKGYEPPFAFTKGWEDEVRPIREFKVNIELDISQIPERDDYTFWYFGLHDKDCNELYREDIRMKDGALFNKHKVTYSNTVLIRERPVKYIIWPHSKESGWHERLVFDIPKDKIT